MVSIIPLGDSLQKVFESLCEENPNKQKAKMKQKKQARDFSKINSPFHAQSQTINVLEKSLVKTELNSLTLLLADVGPVMTAMQFTGRQSHSSIFIGMSLNYYSQNTCFKSFYALRINDPPQLLLWTHSRPSSPSSYLGKKSLIAVHLSRVSGSVIGIMAIISSKRACQAMEWGCFYMPVLHTLLLHVIAWDAWLYFKPMSSHTSWLEIALQE